MKDEDKVVPHSDGWGLFIFMTYSDKLKDPRWQKKRLKILERDEWRCVYCLDSKATLHIHHKKYTGNPWDTPDSELETVCKHCHYIITDNESPNGLPVLKCSKEYLNNDGVVAFVAHFSPERQSKFIAVYEFEPKSDISVLKLVLLKKDLNRLTDLLNDSNG